MKPAPFKYVRPDTVDEALSVLAEYGEDVRVIAGGQSLGAMLNMRIVTPVILLDINRIGVLAGIVDFGQNVLTGAMTRQRDALDNPTVSSRVPLLSRALTHVGHYQTRNRGTLGGSVAHADPSAEIPLALVTLDGEVELRSKKRTRTLNSTKFFRSALVTDRAADELLTSLRWRVRRPSESFGFSEFCVRDGDFAIVAVACVIDRNVGRIRLGFGGCGEAPQVVQHENMPGFGSSIIEDLVNELAKPLDYRSDLLASAAYRRQLANVLAIQAVKNALTTEVAHA